MKMARKEIQRISEYDYLIINDDLKKAAEILRIIAISARVKVSDNEINEFIQTWEDID